MVHFYLKVVIATMLTAFLICSHINNFPLICMTAFAPTQIPASVDTVEKLAVWATELLSYLYHEETFIEEVGRSELAVTAGPFQIAANNTVTFRHIARAAIELNRDFKSGGDIWGYAQPLGNLTIPANFSD